jgi:hypothetical protein
LKTETPEKLSLNPFSGKTVTDRQSGSKVLWQIMEDKFPPPCYSQITYYKITFWTWFFAGIKTNLSENADVYCYEIFFVFNGSKMCRNQQRFLSNVSIICVTVGVTLQRITPSYSLRDTTHHAESP